MINMLYAMHTLVIAAFIAAPIIAVIFALTEAARQRARAAGRLFVSVLIGSALGIGATAIYAAFVNGRAGAWQFFLAIYFATSMMLLLNLLDALVRRISAMLMLIAMPGVARTPIGSSPRSRQLRLALVQMLLGLFRGAILIVIGLPYFISLAATYRPKVVRDLDPQSVLGCEFSSVSFPATDGLSIAGWWIPASETEERPASAGPRAADFGTKTIILCHGFAGNKSAQMNFARRLLPAGYNILVFDFRAHGESSGQLTSLGDLERRDVLGAVRWIRQQHPDQAKKIFGVGTNMGGAALIAAAADQGQEGQAIDAIAVYGVYDELPGFVADICKQVLIWPLDRLTVGLGLSLASVQVDTNLSRFNPSKLVNDIWPRPILIMHRVNDETVDFDRGSRLFDSAPQPKQRFWIRTERQSLDDERAAQAVRRFFDSAVSIPVI